MKNKVLAMLLALCMVMSLLPVTVFATTLSEGDDCPTCGCALAASTETTKCHVDTDEDEGYSCAHTTTGTADCKKYEECTAANCAKDGQVGTSNYVTKPHTHECKECGCEIGNDKCCSETKCGCEDITDAADACECEDCEHCAELTDESDTGDEGGDDAEPCSLKGCTLEAGHRGDHVVPCTCEVYQEQPAADKCTSVSHKNGTCGNKVNVPQGENAATEAAAAVCGACQKSIEVNTTAAAAATAAAVVSCAPADGQGGQATVGNAKCESAKHEDGCPKKCDVGDCTLTKGHEGNHNNTVCLAGKPGCNPEIKADEHDIACDNYVVTPASPGCDSAKDYIVVEWSVDCGCEDNTHEGHDNCAGTVANDGTGGVKVSVKFYFEYEWPVMNPDTYEPFTAAQIATVKAEMLRVAKLKAEDDATKSNYEEALKLLAEGDDLCAACKTAEEDGEEENLDPEVVKAQLELCDGTYDCRAGADVEGGNKAAYHHKNCLSLCTMGSDCKNTVGDSTAHQVEYWVYVTAYDAIVVGGQNVRRTVKTAAAPIGIAWKTVEDARNYIASLKTNDGAPNQNGEQVQYGYSIRALHCPQAKVPDGVVVNEAGEVVAPVETPDKPTKAEDFTDMEDWMAEGVQFMLDKGWMEGLGDGKFGGRDDLKTTMVLTVLARMNGETITGTTWADDAKAWAEKNAEFFEGIDLTSENMARKDVVLVLWRQAGKPEPSADFELEFTDVEGLEGDHLTAMKWAVENKIVLGNGDGTVSPNGNINRSALSLLVMRADKASSK